MALLVLELSRRQNSMTFSLADNRVKMWRFSDVSELTPSPSSGCVYTEQGRTPSHQFWFYLTTSTPWRWGRSSLPKRRKTFISWRGCPLEKIYWYGVVCLVTRLRSGRRTNRGSIASRTTKCFSSPKRPKPPVQMVTETSTRRSSSRRVQLTTHFHLVPRLIMHGGISPLSHVPSSLAQGQLYIFTFSFNFPTYAWHFAG